MKWVIDLFDSKKDRDLPQIAAALSDPESRRLWFVAIFDEITNLNHAVDRQLMDKDPDPRAFTMLSVRRKTLEWVIDQILSAQDKAKELDHNP